MKKHFFKLTALCIATTLAACGGGGGGMSAAPTPAPVAVAQAGNLLTAMPNSVYSPGTTTALAFNELNTARLAGGYGAATQNMQLDKAAAAHAIYFFSKWFTRPVMSVDENFKVQRDSLGNVIYWKGMDPMAVQPDPLNGNVLRAHLETPGEAGFTGVMPSHRAAAAGYGFSNTVGEVIGLDLRNGRASCIQGLLSTVYHRQGVLDPANAEVGIGNVTSFDAAQFPCVVKLARGGTPRVVPDNWVGVFPGVGAANIALKLTGEVPNPAPEFIQTGQAISVFVAPANTITVNKFTLTTAGGSLAAGKLLTEVTDTNKGYLNKNHAVFLPRVPLEPMTVYTVVFEGVDTNPKGVSVTVSKTWSFTTGNSTDPAGAQK